MFQKNGMEHHSKEHRLEDLNIIFLIIVMMENH